jgi:hypothetical protein
VPTMTTTNLTASDLTSRQRGDCAASATRARALGCGGLICPSIDAPGDPLEHRPKSPRQFVRRSIRVCCGFLHCCCGLCVRARTQRAGRRSAATTPDWVCEAEGPGFEPGRPLTRPNGFQDRRIQPLCHPSAGPADATRSGGPAPARSWRAMQPLNLPLAEPQERWPSG